MSELNRTEFMRKFCYCQISGRFIRKINCGKEKAGAIAGWAEKESAYRRIEINKKAYREHRLVWFYVHGVWPTFDIDHINGDRADNRIANLRDVHDSVNQQNLKGAKRNNKTGYLGVHLERGKYVATITHSGNTYYLGQFNDAQTAYAVYLAEKRKHHVGCTI